MKWGRNTRRKWTREGPHMAENRQRGAAWALAVDFRRTWPAPGETTVGFGAEQQVFADGSHVYVSAYRKDARADHMYSQ
jgi:hypothetical protein